MFLLKLSSHARKDLVPGLLLLSKAMYKLIVLVLWLLFQKPGCDVLGDGWSAIFPFHPVLSLVLEFFRLFTLLHLCRRLEKTFQNFIVHLDILLVFHTFRSIRLTPHISRLVIIKSFHVLHCSWLYFLDWIAESLTLGFQLFLSFLRSSLNLPLLFFFWVFIFLLSFKKSQFSLFFSFVFENFKVLGKSFLYFIDQFGQVCLFALCLFGKDSWLSGVLRGIGRQSASAWDFCFCLDKRLILDYLNQPVLLPGFSSLHGAHSARQFFHNFGFFAQILTMFLFNHLRCALITKFRLLLQLPLKCLQSSNLVRLCTLDQLP